MRMLLLSLKAITPLVHSQCRPTGHVTSRKVNIFAANLRFGENSVVNFHWRIAGKIAGKKVKSREAVKHRAAKPSSQQEPQEAGKQQSREARRSIAHQREGTEYPVSGGQELLYSVVNTHPEFSD